MINILIKDTDLLFKNGMQILLQDIFANAFKESVAFLSEYNRDNIARADVIVRSLCQGERYTCLPELQARTRGIIIGLVSEDNTSELPPSCFSDIVFITRRSSLSGVADKISRAWAEWLKSKRHENLSHCGWCKHRELSEHQFLLMEQLHRGKAVNKIASELGIRSKTIHAHKYQVMHKFNLRNDVELKFFLEMLMKKQSISRGIRQR